MAVFMLFLSYLAFDAVYSKFGLILMQFVPKIILIQKKILKVVSGLSSPISKFANKERVK